MKNLSLVLMIGAAVVVAALTIDHLASGRLVSALFGVGILAGMGLWARWLLTPEEE